MRRPYPLAPAAEGAGGMSVSLLAVCLLFAIVCIQSFRAFRLERQLDAARAELRIIYASMRLRVKDDAP